MIIDKYLESRHRSGNPIRVGLIGAGEMAKGMVSQVTRYTPGMKVAAIANRTLSKAVDAYNGAGRSPRTCDSLHALQECITSETPAVTDNAELLCDVDGLDLLVEVTGTIAFAASLVLRAMENGKHVLLFNPELDGTLGPILKRYADKAGVMLGGCEGDQPGVIINLYRYVKSLGMRPLLCGNIKGLQDYYRTPATQAAFAAEWGMTPEMVTSFADGTKISIEQACVANATGMGVARRGMLGYEHEGHIDDMTSMYDVEELDRLGGIVDYVVGPKPGPGVFVYATTDDPSLKRFLQYGKLGDGPLYSFYTPYHLMYLEIPHSIARMVVFEDTVMEPLGGPVVEVITCAKRDLKAGQVIDGIGGYDSYGQCENAETVRAEDLLPIGLSKGARLKRDVPKDEVISFNDVEMPEEDLVQRLYKEQGQAFCSGAERKHDAPAPAAAPG